MGGAPFDIKKQIFRILLLDFFITIHYDVVDIKRKPHRICEKSTDGKNGRNVRKKNQSTAGKGGKGT